MNCLLLDLIHRGPRREWGARRRRKKLDKSIKIQSCPARCRFEMRTSGEERQSALQGDRPAGSCCHGHFSDSTALLITDLGSIMSAWFPPHSD